MSASASDCAHCETPEGALTRDHVPPKGLFPDPLPSDLITVPSCQRCNGDCKKDEEYFIVVVVGEAVSFSEDASRVFDRLFPVVAAPRQRKGVAQIVQRQLREVEVHSQGGIILGKATAIEIDTSRVNRVLRKIVRGLFFHEYGRRYAGPTDFWAEIKPAPELTEHPLFQRLLREPSKMLGPRVFEYKVVAAEDNPDRTLWAMSFYDCILAIACTGPPRAGRVRYPA